MQKKDKLTEQQLKNVKRLEKKFMQAVNEQLPIAIDLHTFGNLISYHEDIVLEAASFNNSICTLKTKSIDINFDCRNFRYDETTDCFVLLDVDNPQEDDITYYKSSYFLYNQYGTLYIKFPTTAEIKEHKKQLKEQQN